MRQSIINNIRSVHFELDAAKSLLEYGYASRDSAAIESLQGAIDILQTQIHNIQSLQK